MRIAQLIGWYENHDEESDVEKDGWVQADANGILLEVLKGPKEGAGRFYRVIVRDAFPKCDFYR